MQEDLDSFNLACTDRLFLGEGLFETIRVFGSKPCFSELHWQRLRSSASRLGLSFSLSVEAWQQLLLEKIQQEHLFEGGIKIILTGGEAPRNLIAKGQRNQLLLQCFTYKPVVTPLRLTSAAWQRDKNNPLYQVKTINYLEAILARRKAKEKGADDVLFFNTQDKVTETTCANIFFVCKGRIVTPCIKDGVLAGITRARVLEKCQTLSLACDVLSIERKIIQNAEAVFLTNTLQGIHYVSSIDEQSFIENHPLIEQLRTLIG